MGNGFTDLDTAQLRYSYKQTCVVTLTPGEVDGHDEWHLPTYDPHNQNKYHYKLHSLDIYFWTQQDALQFANGIRRVLPPGQCEVLDEPGPPPLHSTDVSPVVQNLERVAISDNALSAGSSAPGVPSFGPPPISAVSRADLSPPQAFVPIPYNPASPAAPEQIRPREKTPPPEDGGVNPLHQTLAYDATTPFSPGLAPSGAGPLSPGIPPPQFSPPPGAPSFPGPPQHGLASPGLPPQGFGSLGGAASHLASPPASSTPPPPPPPPPPPAQQHPHQHAHPGIARAATMPVHGLPSPGMTSPYAAGFPFNARETTPTPPGVASPGLQPPAGGFSPYSYVPGAGAAAGAGAVTPDYGVHQQLYRPTEGEAAKKYKPKQEPRGKLEENAGRLERGVTGMFKKFEKKFG